MQVGLMYLITDHCQWADKSDRDQESIDDVSAGWKSGKKYHYILHVSANDFLYMQLRDLSSIFLVVTNRC